MGRILVAGLVSKASTGIGFGFGTLDDASGVLVNIGNISGLTSASIGSAAITAAQMIDFLDDKWYINIHTPTFLGGEIRGQVVTVVPEPATLALFGLALLAVAATRRAKR